MAPSTFSFSLASPPSSITCLEGVCAMGDGATLLAGSTPPDERRGLRRGPLSPMALPCLEKMSVSPSTCASRQLVSTRKEKKTVTKERPLHFSALSPCGGTCCHDRARTSVRATLNISRALAHARNARERLRTSAEDNARPVQSRISHDGHPHRNKKKNNNFAVQKTTADELS